MSHVNSTKAKDGGHKRTINVSVNCEEDESNSIFETPKNQRLMQRQQKKMIIDQVSKRSDQVTSNVGSYKAPGAVAMQSLLAHNGRSHNRPYILSA